MPRTIFAAFAVVCISFGLPSFVETCAMKRESLGCQYWQSKVDTEVHAPNAAPIVDLADEQTVLDGIDCLLQMEGNRHGAKFGGATHLYVSQLFKPTTAEVAALYYISYLYYQKWDHADAVALRDKNGEVNKPRAVRLAYQSYRKWFEQVKRLGLAKARQMKIDPLNDSKVRWY